MKPMPDTLIRASAGSGKTFQLTRRYIALLLAGHDPATILATTFTVKAAGEIVRKVFEVLAGAILDPKMLAELSAQIQDLCPSRKKALTADDCRKAIHRLIPALPSLRICTLDSLFVSALTAQPSRLGLPMEFEVVESARNAELMDRALDQALANRLVDRDGSEQLMGLVHDVERGKANRSPWEALRELTGKPYELFVDAHPDAWRQLKTPPAVPEAELERAIKDLESYAEEKAISKGLAGDLSRFAEKKWDGFLGNGVAKKVRENEEEYSRKPIPPRVRASMQILIRQVAHVLVGEVVAKNEAIRTLLQDFDTQYADVKHREHSYVFGDLPVLLAKAHFNPFQNLGTPIEHVLLDEFQDTSVDQWRALLPALRDVRGKPQRSFFCVGDVKQAIYGWRGGSAELFTRVPEEVPDLQQTSLEVSWRSSPVVIDFVNAVFERIEQNAAVQNWGAAASSWQQAFKRHSEKRKIAGYVRVETALAASADDDRRLVTLQHAAAQVKALHERAPDRSIGVLTRTNDAVARLIFELGELDIRASEEGGVPLTDSSAVLVILSALTMADHPADTAAVFNVRNSPLASVIGLAPEDDGRRAAMEIRRDLLLHGYGPVIAKWVAALARHCDARNLVRLNHLERLAFHQSDADPVRPGEFAEFIRTQQVEDPSSSLVRVMTIHKAKGLEFDVVVLPDLDRNLVVSRSLMVAGRSAPAEPFNVVCSYASEAVRGFFPDDIRNVFSRYQNALASEALCNLYVAITRPRHALHVILAPSKDNEKSLPKTYAGVLRAALAATAPLAPGTLIHESGDPEWATAVDRGRPRPPPEPPRPRVEEGRHAGHAGASTAKAEARRVPGEGPDDLPLFTTLEPSAERRANALILPGRSRFFTRTTPSEQADNERSQIPLRSLFDISVNVAADRGTAIHALLQMIGWVEDGLPSDEQRVRALSAEHRSHPGKILSEFREMLARPAVQERLSRRYYAKAWGERCKGQPMELKLYRELPFAHLDGEQLVSGKIDRLVIGYLQGKAVAAEVLDYKTDAGEPAELTVHYAPQMAAYRQSAARFTRLPAEVIECHLVLLRRGWIE